MPATGSDRTFAVALDAAGDVFFEANGDIAKFDPRTGVQATVASGMGYVSGLALDGAGNIFATACSTPSCGVVKIAAGTGIQTPVGEGLSSDFGVAVDARGNLFIVDFGAPDGFPRLVRVSAATGRQATLLGGEIFRGSGIPLLNNPSGVAVDGADDVFVACTNNGPVYELTPSGVLEKAGSFGAPLTVATDAAGDLFVNNSEPVFELAADTGILTDVADNPGISGIALDGAGNLFMVVFNTLVEVNSAQPPTLNFGTVAVGSTSAPQSISIQNVGTQPLNAVSPGLTEGTNFLQVPGSGTPADCTNSFSLAPGASCNLSIVFAPQVAGEITGEATFTDNALNKTPSASQIVGLIGTGAQ